MDGAGFRRRERRQFGGRVLLLEILYRIGEALGLAGLVLENGRVDNAMLLFWGAGDEGEISLLCRRPRVGEVARDFLRLRQQQHAAGVLVEAMDGREAFKTGLL